MTTGAADPKDVARDTGTTRLQRWEKLVDETLLLLSVLFIVVFSVPVLWPDAEVWVLRGCAVAEQGIWFLFAADLVVRTA
ncbi:MAG: voltage-gated potassium channel, partial [Actinomycetota bacterium]|nr:voltage-gated potassium channel [Actinomycetota bacterium]